jgi:hypothetical protein
LREEGAP